MNGSHSNCVTVIGAGSGGCAGAAELGLAGYEVTLFNRSAERLAPIKAVGGVHLRLEGIDHGVVPLAHMTTSLAEAIGRSRTVLVMAPTSAHRDLAMGMAPYLSEEHRVLLAPGHTGGALHVRAVVDAIRPGLQFLLGETHTLPYICRMTGPAQVTVWSRSRKLLAAALPATRTDELIESFGNTFLGLTAAGSVLETSLSNHNAVMHPVGMILNAGWIEHTGGSFHYYAEGNTAAVSRVIEALDTERLTIAAAVDAAVSPFIDAFYAGGATTEEAWRSGSVQRAISESGPNQEIVAPSTLDHRYVHEDVSYGLVPCLALAEVAGVATPATAAMVNLAEIATGFPLRANGLDGNKLGIAGLGSKELVDLAYGGAVRARPGGSQ